MRNTYEALEYLKKSSIKNLMNHEKILYILFSSAILKLFSMTEIVAFFARDETSTKQEAKHMKEWNETGLKYSIVKC